MFFFFVFDISFGFYFKRMRICLLVGKVKTNCVSKQGYLANQDNWSDHQITPKLQKGTLFITLIPKIPPLLRSLL